MITELYCTGQQNPNIKTDFLPAGPSGRLNRQAWSRSSNFSLCSHLRDNSIIIEAADAHILIVGLY